MGIKKIKLSWMSNREYMNVLAFENNSSGLIVSGESELVVKTVALFGWSDWLIV